MPPRSQTETLKRIRYVTTKEAVFGRRGKDVASSPVISAFAAENTVPIEVQESLWGSDLLKDLSAFDSASAASFSNMKGSSNPRNFLCRRSSTMKRLRMIIGSSNRPVLRSTANPAASVSIGGHQE